MSVESPDIYSHQNRYEHDKPADLAGESELEASDDVPAGGYQRKIEEEPTNTELLIEYLLGQTDEPPAEFGVKEMTGAFGVVAQIEGRGTTSKSPAWQKRFKDLQAGQHARSLKEGRFDREIKKARNRGK